MLKMVSRLVLIVSAMLLVACGSTPQPPVKFTTNQMAKNDVKIGFYVKFPEKATTHIYGANCLLCYGVASSLTGGLDKYLKTLTNEELNNLSSVTKTHYQTLMSEATFVDIEEKLPKLKKFKTKEKFGFAKRDFRPLKEALDIDYLVVVDFKAHGAARTFANYIPVSDPQGFVSAEILGVDLTTNALSHYSEISERVQPEGDWDNGDNYPNVTLSYYQAIERVKNIIDQSFSMPTPVMGGK